MKQNNCFRAFTRDPANISAHVSARISTTAVSSAQVSAHVCVSASCLRQRLL